MSPLDLFLVRFLLASAGCLVAGLAVWTLAMQLRRWPALQMQRSAWLLGQATVLAAFLVILLPHSERLRIVPPIELSEDIAAAAPAPLAPAASAQGAKLEGVPPPGATRPLLAWAALGWLGVYLLGLVLTLSRLIGARRMLCALAASGEAHSAGAPGAAGLRVIEVDAPISPMLFGLARPRLLLPRHLRSFDPLQQQMMIEHELTHVRRRDLHWMSAGLLLQTLLWFNPFMRLLRERLSWAQELGCDRAVLDGRPADQRKAYAAALLGQLKLQLKPHHEPLHAALAFGGVSAGTVAERIALIREPAAGAGRWIRLAAAGGLSAILAGTLALQPALAWRDGAIPLHGELSCTVIADAATGARLVQEGQCDERVTPASTFNIAVSLMGYDSGILVDEHTPALPFKQGYADWNPLWRATTDPSSWLERSVLWYAQQVTVGLGPDRFARYVRQFGYGNGDLSGDGGSERKLALAWVNSSLRISASEQVDFLARMLGGRLQLAPGAFEKTARIMPSQILGNGWQVHGKTGTANPVLRGGRDDESRQYGWYVGWAEKDGRKLVFARLKLDARQQKAAGLRAKQAFLSEFPQRLAGP